MNTYRVTMHNIPTMQHPERIAGFFDVQADTETNAEIKAVRQARIERSLPTNQWRIDSVEAR